MPAEFRPTEILRRLVDHRVEFIVVGGVASALAGSTVSTRDLDIVFRVEGPNLDRLLDVLGQIGARYRDPAGRTIHPDQEKLASVRINLLETELGDLDLLREIGDGLSFEDLETRTVEYDLGDLRIRAIDLDTLIETKTFAGRPKDLYALPFLRALRAEQER